MKILSLVPGRTHPSICHQRISRFDMLNLRGPPGYALARQRRPKKALAGKQRRLWHTLADFGALWQGNREGFDRPEKALTCYGMKTKKALARLYETPARCGFVYPLPVHPIPFHSGRVFGVIRTRLRSGPGTFGSMKWLW
jgi:hypothetical protein